MEAAIDANIPLDHIEFDIAPSQNRYEACVCYENKKEKLTSGPLEHLLLHSEYIKALHLKGSNAKYKLYPPKNPHETEWFTKSTTIRFLHIIGSENILDITNSLKNEISQLEEARRFHLSLYAKGREYQLQSGDSDVSRANGLESTTKAEDSDASKNELLRAIDLRLNALREELNTAFDQAAGSRYSVEEMTDLEKFANHFGSRDLSDSLQKHIELRHGAEAIEKSSSKHFSESDNVKSKAENNHRSKSAFSETTVKYGVSPAKAAQVERQSSTESDESSLSSEEEQPSVERSRPLVRSASPRRSASPMRRVQIGRSGSRRSTAITIKSLNYYPNIKSELDPEHSSKRPENNARRMSVQDAINLFESKQKDQTVDNQKARSSLGASKSVLRRWSSGMGEDSPQCPQDSSTEIQNNVESTEVAYSSSESEAEAEDLKLDSSEKEECTSVVLQEETRPTESTERLVASAEWGRQKEAELNELLMKMMQTKPVKSQTVVPPSSKRQSLPSEQRGGFYDHYKERRDEKLRGEASRKKTEKDKQFRASLDAKKPQNASDAGRKPNVKKLQKPQSSVSTIPANPKAESPRLGFVKKASPKASSLPSTRKSLPSMPLSGARGPSPAKTPASTTPTRRKSQPTTPVVSQPSTKVQTSHIQAKTVKLNEKDIKKIPKVTEKKQPPAMKPRKIAKSKVQTAPEDLVSSAKPSKMTKKSSVVPVESKPFLRKGSKTTSSVNPSLKKKVSHPQEPLRKSEDPTLADDNPTVVKSYDILVLDEETEIGELEIQTGPQQSEDKEESISEVNLKHPAIDEVTYRVEEPELKEEAEEESTISPTAWVEIEEHEDNSIIDPICPMVESPVYKAPMKVSSPRVRHSLSQMLLEESSEPDVIDWGNAENPPAMVYHKDAPKGFKRLLKFARKSKTEASSTGCSSPSVFSEGEDDSEDSKFLSKRSSENLLRIATLHSMNNGHQKSSTDHDNPGQANIRKLNVQSLSHHIQEGNVSASVTTTKATRSFFSLSAFKGSK